MLAQQTFNELRLLTSVKGLALCRCILGCRLTFNRRKYQRQTEIQSASDLPLLCTEVLMRIYLKAVSEDWNLKII